MLRNEFVKQGIIGLQLWATVFLATFAYQPQLYAQGTKTSNPTDLPIWWTQGTPPVIDPAVDENNAAPASIGQAKYMLTRFLQALESYSPLLVNQMRNDLFGSSGPLSSLDPPTTPEEVTLNKQVLLTGQLKAISAPIYRHLGSTVPKWLEGQLQRNQTQKHEHSFFPWSEEREDDQHFSPATTGQLKAIFALRLDNSQDGDSTSDFLEWLALGTLENDIDANADDDNDGISNKEELLAGSDYLDPINDTALRLAIGPNNSVFLTALSDSATIAGIPLQATILTTGESFSPGSTSQIFLSDANGSVSFSNHNLTTGTRIRIELLTGASNQNVLLQITNSEVEPTVPNGSGTWSYPINQIHIEPNQPEDELDEDETPPGASDPFVGHIGNHLQYTHYEKSTGYFFKLGFPIAYPELSFEPTAHISFFDFINNEVTRETRLYTDGFTAGTAEIPPRPQWYSQSEDSRHAYLVNIAPATFIYDLKIDPPKKIPTPSSSINLKFSIHPPVFHGDYRLHLDGIKDLAFSNHPNGIENWGTKLHFIRTHSSFTNPGQNVTVEHLNKNAVPIGFTSIPDDFELDLSRFKNINETDTSIIDSAIDSLSETYFLTYSDPMIGFVTVNEHNDRNIKLSKAENPEENPHGRDFLRKVLLYMPFSPSSSNLHTLYRISVPENSAYLIGDETGAYAKTIYIENDRQVILYLTTDNSSSGNNNIDELTIETLLYRNDNITDTYDFIPINLVTSFDPLRWNLSLAIDSTPEPGTPPPAPRDTDHTKNGSTEDISASPQYRKISLTGRPISDESPQSEGETDLEPEETYIDAFTRQLRHSVTDVFIPVPSSELALSVRRNAQTAIWKRSQSPDNIPPKAFGELWSSNLTSYILDERFVKLSPQEAGTPPNTIDENETDELTETQPDVIYVTDEDGSRHRFAIDYEHTNSNSSPPLEKYVPWPQSITEQDSYQTSLTRAAGGHLVFSRKFGNTLTYSPVIEFMDADGRPVTDIFQPQNKSTPGSVRIKRNLRRLESIEDRYGNKLIYDYGESTTNFVPHRIYVAGQEDLAITITQDSQGLVQSVSDPLGKTVTYSYAEQSFTRPRFSLRDIIPPTETGGDYSINKLSEVAYADTSSMSYGYESQIESDHYQGITHGMSTAQRWTRDSSDPSGTNQVADTTYHLNLNSITDSYGNTTSFKYEWDHSHSHEVNLNLFGQPTSSSTTPNTMVNGDSLAQYQGPVTTSGVPRKISSITLPNLSPVDPENPEEIVVTLTGSSSNANTIQVDLSSSIPPSNLPQSPEEYFTTVTDAEGHSRTYTWSGLKSVAFATKSKLLTQEGIPKPRNINLNFWTTLTIAPEGGGSEIYRFDHEAGMALKSVTDFSGNTKSYTHNQDLEGNETIGEITVNGRPWSSYLSISNGVENGPPLSKQYPKEPTSYTNALNQTTRYAYGPHRIMTTSIDPSGLRTDYEVDSLGRRTCISVTKTTEGSITPGALLKKESFVFHSDVKYDTTTGLTHPNFLTKSSLDNLGIYTAENPDWVTELATLYEPEMRNDLPTWRVGRQAIDMNANSVIDAGDLITSYTYDVMGNKTSSTDPNGLTTWFNYDNRHRLTGVTYADGTSMTYTYDLNGNKVMTTDENGHSIGVIFDKRNRPVSTIVDMNGDLAFNSVTRSFSGISDEDLVSHIDYNEVNSPTVSTDARGYKSQTIYDYLQRPTQIYTPGPSRTPGELPDSVSTDQLTQLFYETERNTGGSAFDSSGFKPTRVIDSRGYEATTTYDALYRSKSSLSQYQLDPPLYAYSSTDYLNDHGAQPEESTVYRTPYTQDAVPTADPPLGNTTHTAYDDLYRPTITTSGYGASDPNIISEVTTSYTATGFAHRSSEKVTDTRNRVTDIEFDTAGRSISTQGPAVLNPVTQTLERPTSTTIYDDNSNVIATIDPNNNRWDSFYDARNRKWKSEGPLVKDQETSSPSRPTTEYIYDAAGNLTHTIDPRGHTSIVIYDDANRPTHSLSNPVTGSPSEDPEAPHPHDILSSSIYDENGNITTAIDGNSHKVFNVYDGLNRLVRTATNPTNGRPTEETRNLSRPRNFFSQEIIIDNVYDKGSNLIRVIDGQEQVTAFDFDGLNRSVATHWDADSTTRKRSTYNDYDAILLIKERTADGEFSEMFYDQRFRMTDVTFSRDSHDDRHYTLDRLDRTTAVTYPNASAAHQAIRNCSSTYDDLDRLTSETSAGATHTHTYDLVGNHLTQTFGNTSTIITSTYDALNRLDTLTESSNGAERLTSYSYDLNGNILLKEKPNGVWEICRFDALNRKIYSESQSATGERLTSFDYSRVDGQPGYDSVGNVIHIQEAYSTQLGIKHRTLTNTYDSTNRLFRESVIERSASPAVSKTTEYHYDFANNRRSILVFGSDPSEEKVEIYTYGSEANGLNSNQLNSFTINKGSTTTEKSYAYDEKGNRTATYDQIDRQGPITVSYVYDQLNRLTQLTDNSDSTSQVHTYSYDHRTRRVLRDESLASGTSDHISFSGGTSLQEYTGTNTVPNVEYIRGSDYGGGIGGILYTTRNGQASFNSYNSRGDVVSKTDSTGSLTWQATYEAFGTRTQEEGENLDRQRGNTKEEDPTGLLNEGMRYRDLETGVFITRDPAGFVDGPNVYTYVKQNPWTFFDPLGLASESETYWKSEAKSEDNGAGRRIYSAFRAAGAAMNPFKSDSSLREGNQRLSAGVDQAAKNLDANAPPVVSSIGKFALGVGSAGSPSGAAAGIGELGSQVKENGLGNTVANVAKGIADTAVNNPEMLLGQLTVGLASGKAIMPSAKGIKLTTDDGFLLKGFNVKAPFNIPVQRFGNMSLGRPDFWGLRIGPAKLANRTLAAIKPEWNALTQYTQGVIPKGTSMKVGVIGPQGLKYPGGSVQFITKSREVVNQTSKTTNK